MSRLPLHLTVSLSALLPIGRRVQGMARAAEAGAFDAVWLEGAVDPLPLLGSLIAVTERIGLGAFWGVGHTEPFNVARVFATLDHLSGGRAGWVVGLPGDGQPEPAFGHAAVLDAGAALARGRELVDVVRQLWDSWEDEGLLLDVASGRFADPALVHPIEHVGPYFSVRGPLNVPRSVQGNPVLVMALSAEGEARAWALAEADVLLAPWRSPAEVVALPGFAGRVLVDAAARGTPAEMVDWFGSWGRGCDGFNLRFASVEALQSFVADVVPLGRARGLFRAGYEGVTLREHLRLPRPRSRFSA